MDDKQFTTLLPTLPDDISSRRAYLAQAKQDPAVFCAYFRRLRGHPLTFDNSQLLTEKALQELRDTSRDDRAFEQEHKTRLLHHRPWLVKPIRDLHPHKVYEKARQVGVSEASITEASWFLWSRREDEKSKWVYTFPRDTQLKDFSNTRIAEMFRETKLMERLLTGANQVYAKRIGNGYLLLRSAWEAGLGEGIDADAVTFDEKDRMKEGIEVAFKESLSSSKYGLIREVSTPSLPNKGVDVSFRNSDQQTWLVKCENGHEQEITYEDNVVQVKGGDLIGVRELAPGTFEYLCKLSKCRKPLNRQRGRWVAKHPSVVNIRGYHISQLMAVWISATELMQKKIQHKFYQLWANYCLGITAKGENMLVGEDDIERLVGCSSEYPLGYPRQQFGRSDVWNTISVGIDWGHINWVVVMAHNCNGRPYIVDVGYFEDSHKDHDKALREIEQFLLPWQPDIIIADQGWGKDRNAYLIKKFEEGSVTPAEVIGCQYNPSTKGSRTFQPVWGDHRVLVDRTMTLKVMARTLKLREFGIPTLDDPKMQLWKKHIVSLTTLMQEEENADTGETEVVENIQSIGKEDHFAHATAYALLGFERIAKAGRFVFDFC